MFSSGKLFEGICSLLLCSLNVVSYKCCLSGGCYWSLSLRSSTCVSTTPWQRFPSRWPSDSLSAWPCDGAFCPMSLRDIGGHKPYFDKLLGGLNALTSAPQTQCVNLRAAAVVNRPNNLVLLFTYVCGVKKAFPFI